MGGEFIRMKGPDGQDHIALLISAGSYEVDASGKPLLRVVDGAPWAYDAVNDLQKTSRSRTESVTVQTHNAVSVGASGNNVSAWVSCKGFNELSLILMNDAGTSSTVDVEWSTTGSGNAQGKDFTVIPAGTSNIRASFTPHRLPVKADFFRVIVTNGDASPHTMSSWTTLIP